MIMWSGTPDRITSVLVSGLSSRMRRRIFRRRRRRSVRFLAHLVTIRTYQACPSSVNARVKSMRHDPSERRAASSRMRRVLILSTSRTSEDPAFL